MLSWLSRLFSQKEDYRSDDQAEYIAGVNLNDWNYLGYTLISFTDTETEKTVGTAIVHGFVHKKTNKRDFKVEEIFENPWTGFSKHEFIVMTMNVWKAQEIVSLAGPFTMPSRYLKDYMAKKGYKYSHEKDTWIPIDKKETEDESEEETSTIHSNV